MNLLNKQALNHILVNNLEYLYIKHGNGPVIFFLHGFPDSAYTWSIIIDELSKNYTCIVPFLRGYYPTEIPKDGDYSMTTIATDINKIASALDINTYSVVGHDWGATVAYTMANMFPKRIAKICTIGMPHPKFLKPTFSLLYKARHIIYLMNEEKSAKRVSKNHFQYLTKLYKRWSPNWKDYNKTRDQIMTDFSKEGRIKAALGYYWQLKNKADNLEKSKIYNQLPQVPLLTLVGKKDGTVVLKQFKQMERELKSDFKLFIHPTAGHFLHQENPLFVINALKMFFAKNKGY